MKAFKYFSTLIVFVVSINLLAQEETGKFKLLKKILDPRESTTCQAKNRNVLFIDYGVLNTLTVKHPLDFSSNNHNFATLGSSNTITLGYLHRIHNAQRRFKVALGVGIERNELKFQEAIHLPSGAEKFEIQILEQGTNIESKLQNIYVQMPLVFQFRLGGIPDELRKKSKKNRKRREAVLIQPQKFAFGIIPAINVGSKLVRTTTMSDRFQKEKINASNQIRKAKLMGTFRMSFKGNIGLFVNYDLLNLFQYQNSPNLHNLNIGLTVGGIL